jgi:hypothetical protein
MATAPRLLLPDLPPELRNEIYNYLSAPEPTSHASIVGLPLKLKTYECKHTTVQICRAHYGSTGLLALKPYRFEEAREYDSWLLNNAIELKIGVTFKGRVNTFVQKDWDKKMEAHLRKLAKLHPWMKKVAKYDIQISWAPVDGMLMSRKGRKVAGQIPRDMVSTLTVLMDEGVKKKRGDVAVQLHLAHTIAAQIYILGTRFGFAEFLASDSRFKRLTLEVRKEAYTKPSPVPAGSLLVPVPVVKEEERSLLVIQKGLVKWICDGDGELVVKKRLVDSVSLDVAVGGSEEHNAPTGNTLLALVRECLGQT